jgi:hypothetical protein
MEIRSIKIPHLFSEVSNRSIKYYLMWPFIILVNKRPAACKFPAMSTEICGPPRTGYGVRTYTRVVLYCPIKPVRCSVFLVFIVVPSYSLPTICCRDVLVNLVYQEGSLGFLDHRHAGGPLSSCSRTPTYFGRICCTPIVESFMASTPSRQGGGEHY